jgi:hypothetical protein
MDDFAGQVTRCFVIFFFFFSSLDTALDMVGSVVASSLMELDEDPGYLRRLHIHCSTNRHIRLIHGSSKGLNDSVSPLYESFTGL